MKIIASDYDGTLNNNGISSEDIEAINSFRRQGNKFGIVTGRDLEQALWVMYDLRKNNLKVDFLICCTGAIILSTEGEVVSKKTTKVTPGFEKIISKAREIGFGSFNINNCLKRVYIDPMGKIPTKLEQIDELTQINAWFDDEKKAKLFCDYINSEHSDILNAFQNGGSVDIPPKGVSKVSGIYDYASEFENVQIYAVGDNVNDLPMIKEFDSYAVSNARDALKKEAKHSCERIADMIKEIMGGEIK